MCSLYINPWYRVITKYGKQSMDLYCKKHGYDFIWETEETKDSVYDGQRDIPWYKIKLIEKIMKHHPEYDFIVWNDADSMIVDDEKKLENLIEKYLGDKDILLAKDWMSTLNTGTMFIRNTPYCLELMSRIWANTSARPELHEQASLQDLFAKNEFDEQGKIEVLPLHLQNEFLTYWHSYRPNQCFIYHATRCSHDRRGFIFMMDMFCPLKMDEETDKQHQDRLNWMKVPEMCRADIKHYLNKGQRLFRNCSQRYILYETGRLKGC